ncbi:MAG: integrase [Desulfuromonas sp.]|nr:MAG: integrase [Desulfuromonas sp.]
MARLTKPLTATEVKNAKPAAKQYKLFDGKGLYLLIKPSGSKGWRLKYRFGSKEKLLSLGPYPTVSLSDARDKRETALKQLDKGIDPSLAKKTEKQALIAQQANTFKKLAEEWFSQQDSLADSTKYLLWRRLKLDVFPVIGNFPISELTPKIILEGVLRPMEKRGVNEMTHRTKSLISRICRYGVACGYLDRDITVDLRGALKPVKKEHHSAITDPGKVGQLLRSIDDYDGSLVVKYALQLAPLLFVRPGELRSAEWSDIDFKKSLWTIPEGKMKMKQSHIVPLPKQALAILWKLQPLTERSKYLFPSHRSNTRPLSNNAINAALRRMGYEKNEMTGHGFRAMARTLLDEVLQFRPDFIEHQLAHAVRDPLGRAYNRTTHLAERKKMMQEWANYLDELKKYLKK